MDTTIQLSRRAAVALLAGSAALRSPPTLAQAGGFAYTPPAGWKRQATGADTIYSATLRPEPRARHEARMFVFAPRPAPRGLGAAFDAEWRTQFGSLDIGDTVAHYRGRLPGGLRACFMGRRFERAGQDAFFSVVYAIDLGERVQVLAASVVAGWDGVTYPAAAEDSAIRALAQSLFPVLDSIRAPGRERSGALFDAADIHGQWTYESGGYGGSFADRQTGASMGAAVRGASSQLAFRPDGSYDYRFAMYAVNPNSGTDTGPRAQGHSGRYDFADDVITWRPTAPAGSDPRRKVVGAGTWQSPKGPRRLLILVGPDNSRAFQPPPWVPVWSGGYAGLMQWYREAA